MNWDPLPAAQARAVCSERDVANKANLGFSKCYRTNKHRSCPNQNCMKGPPEECSIKVLRENVKPKHVAQTCLTRVL